MVEIVKALPDGGFSVAGITDVGTTLYAARVDPNGQGRIVSKAIPFSDRWVLDGFVAEALIPWKEPELTSQLYELDDGGWSLVCERGYRTDIYTFDDTGQWTDVQRLSDCRLRSQISLEWDEGILPAVMRAENRQRHYRAVREDISDE